MTQDEFNTYCQSLSATHHVVQWGGADVWKVGPEEKGKVFAIAWTTDTGMQITFKVSQIAFEILRMMPGLRPAPYLASRGFSWIQHYDEPGLDDKALREHILTSHQLVSRNFSKRIQEAYNLVL